MSTKVEMCRLGAPFIGILAILASISLAIMFGIPLLPAVLAVSSVAMVLFVAAHDFKP